MSFIMYPADYLSTVNGHELCVPGKRQRKAHSLDLRESILRIAELGRGAVESS